MFHFLVLLAVHIPVLAVAQNECQPTWWGDFGPVIRFPFWLKGHHPEACGFPGFGVSCTSNNITKLQLQFSVTVTTRNIILPLHAQGSIGEINYENQIISLYDMNVSTCLPKQLPDGNSSASQFKVVDNYDTSWILFNCSNTNQNYMSIPCLSNRDHQIVIINSGIPLEGFSLPSCIKMYNVTGLPIRAFELSEYTQYQYQYQYRLSWSEPYCGSCETERKYCKLKSNSTMNETECYGNIPAGLDNESENAGFDQEMNTGLQRKPIVAGVLGGVFALALFILVPFLIVYFIKNREAQKRIDQYLKLHKALRPTRYRYTDIKTITNHFKEKLGQGGYGIVYKGKLSNDILVAVKVLKNIHGDGEEFINEVGSIGRIHHVNVVRLVGYCADGYKRALVYEYLPNETLQKYISSGSHGRKLSWAKLQEIAIGIAKGIDYLHQGCNQRILHFDIKPHNILLDDNFNPKVADFGLAKLCSKEESRVSMTACRGTIGYIAPEVFSRNYANVSYKADIYSFGMVLLDMVGGRRSFLEREEESNEVYFPEWMFNQLEKGEDLAIQTDKEGDNKIIQTLTIVGLWSIQWYPADRPSMSVLIQMLEGDDIPLMPPNPFASTNSTVIATSITGSKFYTIHESISEIE